METVALDNDGCGVVSPTPQNSRCRILFSPPLVTFTSLLRCTTTHIIIGLVIHIGHIPYFC